MLVHAATHWVLREASVGAHKQRVERGTEFFEVDQTGRQLFILERDAAGNESRSTRGFFDDDAARAAAAELLATRRSEGFVESLQTRAERERLAVAKRNSDERQRTHAALAAAADPAAALRGHLLPAFGVSDKAKDLLNQMLSRVVTIEVPSASGFTVQLRGGARIVWAAAEQPSNAKPPDLARLLDVVRDLWLHLEPDSDDHNLLFALNSGPPEGDKELAGTELKGTPVTWFLEEQPWDRYWLAPLKQGAGLRCYEFDGGLRREEHRGPIAEIVLERIVDLLERQDA